MCMLGLHILWFISKRPWNLLFQNELNLKIFSHFCIAVIGFLCLSLCVCLCLCAVAIMARSRSISQLFHVNAYTSDSCAVIWVYNRMAEMKRKQQIRIKSRKFTNNREKNIKIGEWYLPVPCMGTWSNVDAMYGFIHFWIISQLQLRHMT